MLTRISHYFLSTLAITFGLSGSVFAAETSSVPQDFEAPKAIINDSLDWVHAADMTAQQRQQFGRRSCGASLLTQLKPHPTR
jgi:hypothetical protein